MTEIPEGAKCARCRVHLATVMRSASVTDWAHGFTDCLCLCCTIALDIREAERQAALLPKWYDDFASACRGEPLPDPQALLSENAKLRAQGLRQWQAAHYYICGRHYPDGGHAVNHAAPHPPGEHCYWPEPVRAEEA